MKTKLAIIVGVLSVGASLQASTSFNFQNSTYQNPAGDALTVVGTGAGTTVNATLTAYSVATYSSGSTSVSKASIGEYGSNGTGVCDSTDSGAASGTDINCGSPDHQIGNNGQTDFILITFSSAVNLSSIQLGYFGSDFSTGLVDMSYWTNVTTTAVGGVTTYNQAGTSSSSGTVNEITSVSPTGENTISCGGSNPACPAANSSSGTYTYSLTGNDVTSLLISAQYAAGINSSDSSYFKLQDLNVSNYTPSSTPEPASVVLLGSGLLAGAFFGRRRMQKANN